MEHNANNTSALDRSLTEQANAILAAIVATSDDTIISKNLDGIILSWNPASEKMFGYSEDEALGKHISIIIPPDRIEEEDYIINEVKQGRKVDHFETVRKAKNGRMVPISLSVSPIIDANGLVIGASKIARDISERKRADEKQAVLAAIVETSDDAIVSKTLQGTITSWNKAAEKMFGYTESEAVGKHITLIIPPERLDEESYIIGEIIKGNKIDHFHTIPEDKLEEIFSRFYRVDETKSHASGLGLGLYLSQEIVSRHGGTIWAESEQGQGSTFWVKLPLKL